MTNEEMAEEFAETIFEIEPTLSAKDEKHAYRLGRYDGFLAGLRAGRPKWHDLRKNPEDLPKRLKAVWVKTEYDDYCEGYWWPERNRWQDSDMGDGESIGAVIAWCELPKFEDKVVKL